MFALNFLIAFETCIDIALKMSLCHQFIKCNIDGSLIYSIPNNKTENEKYYIVRTVPKYNRTIVETK
jgi:hypothetical protein